MAKKRIVDKDSEVSVLEALDNVEEVKEEEFSGVEFVPSIVVSEEEEETKEEVGEVPVASFVNTTPKAEPEKLVRVRPKSTYHTSIGGTWYYFEKGVCVNVPENVKRIMAEGDMILPL